MSCDQSNREEPVLFADDWSEDVFSEDEAKRRVERDPNCASTIHVAGTNSSYSRYLQEKSARAAPRGAPS
jgi:hypothetical protein